MKAIQVKFLAPTNTQGTRLKAFIKGHSITEGLNYGKETSDQSEHLAIKLMDKLEWTRCRISGCDTLPNGDRVYTIEAA